jgi:hypothetical protein
MKLRFVSPPMGWRRDVYSDAMETEKVRELIFEVREAPEGGYTARALGASIFTEADDWASLEAEIRDAVDCHFEPDDRPSIVRLHFVRDQLLAL